MIRVFVRLDRLGNPIPVFLHQHPYGYRINVYHPDIEPHWMRWRQISGESTHFPVSDDCRLKFEENLIEDWYANLPPDRRPAELCAAHGEIFPSEGQPEEGGQ